MRIRVIHIYSSVVYYKSYRMYFFIIVRRFPEYALMCTQLGTQMLLYPGAFNMTTGPAHWELLQRGRAVDNQCYVATCSPARRMESSYHAWGHSTIVGPWGDVVATTEHDPAVVVAELDFQKVADMRQNIPVLHQKRTDLYSLTASSQ